MNKDHKTPDKNKIEHQVKDKKETAELSDEELKKVAGGNLGAPIFKKKP